MLEQTSELRSGLALWHFGRSRLAFKRSNIYKAQNFMLTLCWSVRGNEGAESWCQDLSAANESKCKVKVPEWLRCDRW